MLRIVSIVQGTDCSSRRTLVALGVRRDSADDAGAETLEIAVVLVPANVVSPAEAHYLKAPGSHCNLLEEFNAPSAAGSLRKPAFSTRGSPVNATRPVFLRKSHGCVGLGLGVVGQLKLKFCWEVGSFVFMCVCSCTCACVFVHVCVCFYMVKFSPILIVALDTHLLLHTVSKPFSFVPRHSPLIVHPSIEQSEATQASGLSERRDYIQSSRSVIDAASIKTSTAAELLQI